MPPEPAPLIGAALDGGLLDGDYETLVEQFYDKGWTDGLPVVIPTPPLVDAMVAASGRARDHVLGLIPPNDSVATVEAVAVNAVMAGLPPALWPLLEATLEAALDPVHHLGGVTCTTHSCVSLIIVNGPQIRRHGFNAGKGVFGNGHRANGSLGRAFRLVCWNLGGARPGESDMSTMSHPGEWCFCIAEDEEGSPWEPFHVDRGLAPGSDAVSVFACEGPQSISAHGDSESMFRSICSHMQARGSNTSEHRWGPGQCLLVLTPDQAKRFAADGFTRASLQQYLWEHTTVSVAERSHRTYGLPDIVTQGLRARYGERAELNDPAARLPLTPSPADILLLVAGSGQGFAAFLPGWGPFGGLSVTRTVAPVESDR